MELALVFWIAAGLLAYVLLVYPAAMWCISRLAVRDEPDTDYAPTVSFLISAHNEERTIGEKLEETLSLEYPKDRLQIIVGSDGSTDATNEIVQRYADRGVVLCHSPERLGKNGILDKARELATGEVIVFSDAPTSFPQETLRRLVAPFEDPRVGCVAGRVSYRKRGDTRTAGYQIYSDINDDIRAAQAVFGYMSSVPGAIHAMRANLYRASPSGMTRDIVDPLDTIAQNYKVRYARSAFAFEEFPQGLANVFRARVRMTVRGSWAAPHVMAILMGRFSLLHALHFVSHKLLRWWLWVPLVIVAVTNLLLLDQGGIYLLAGAGQAAAYAVALFGLAALSVDVRIPGVTSVAFFAANLVAMCIGTMQWLRGSKIDTWQPIREADEAAPS